MTNPEHDSHDFDSLNSRVVRAFASRAIDLGLIPSRLKPMTLKSVFTASLLDAVALNFIGSVWRTNRQVYLLCRWERHLAEFPHLRMVDRWPATPEQACKAHLSLSRDRKINMRLNI